MPPSDQAAAVQPPTRLQLDFHPAGLETLRAVPSPLGRTMLWGVCLFAGLGMLWSIWGTVDVVAVGQGKVIPNDRVKVVQAPEAGVVRAIHVRDGGRVKAGDTLIELDPTTVFASYDQLRDDLRLALLDRARLIALGTDVQNPERAFVVPAGSRPDLIPVQRRMMQGRAAEYRAQNENALADLARRQAESRSLQAQIAKLDSSIPMLAQRVDAKKTLTEKGYGAAMPLLELRQQLSDQEHDRAILHTRQSEVQSNIRAAEAQIRRLKAEFERSVETELSDVERKIAGLRQDLAKAEQRLQYQTILAPADGTVQQLAVNTVGGVLTQGQTALVIVPADTNLEVEALLLNKDIGFVEAGQRAVVKFETFNFTRYGYLEGTVLHVSRDAIEDKAFGLVYAARIALDAQEMMIDGRRTPLSSGMTVTAEIKTDRRSIADFIIAPMVRHQHESLRER